MNTSTCAHFCRRQRQIAWTARSHTHRLSALPTLHNATQHPARGFSIGGIEPLARAFGHPEGTGFIGPGANGLLRATLTEALTSTIGVSWIMVTRTVLNRLFDDAMDDRLVRSLSHRLQVTETLEEAIERLEFEADVTGALNLNSHPTTTASTVLWITAPGPDSDVVHQTLQRWPSDNLTMLSCGPWPYGPTHYIESNGPRPLPHRPINLLTPRQAITKLHVPLADC